MCVCVREREREQESMSERSNPTSYIKKSVRNATNEKSRLAVQALLNRYMCVRVYIRICRYIYRHRYTRASHQWLSGKESTCNARDTGDEHSIPGSGKIPWRSKWQPTPVFLPGKSHEQKSLTSYSLQSHKKLDITEVTEHARMHT